MKKLLPYFFLLFFIASGSLSLPGLTHAANTCTVAPPGSPNNYACTPALKPLPANCGNVQGSTMYCQRPPSGYGAPGSGFIKASPTPVEPGKPITLTWQTTSATNCQITGQGSVKPFGFVTFTPTDSSVTNYTLSCQDADGSGAAVGAAHTFSSASVTFTAPLPPPPPASTPSTADKGTCVWDKSLTAPRSYKCDNPSGALPTDGDCVQLASIHVLACKSQPAAFSCKDPGTSICEPPTIPGPQSTSCVFDAYPIKSSTPSTCDAINPLPSNCTSITGGKMSCLGPPNNTDCKSLGSSAPADTRTCTEQQKFSCTGMAHLNGPVTWKCPLIAVPPSNCRTVSGWFIETRTECVGPPAGSSCNITKAPVDASVVGQMECGSGVSPSTSSPGPGSGGQGGGGAPSTGEGTGGNTPLDYQPLEPIPGFTSGLGSLDIPNLLARLFKILFAVGALLAVVMLVIGGIQYMVSEVVDTKSFARERLLAALYGLLILAGSYLILNTINPDLVSLKFLGTSGAPTSLNPSSTGTGPITILSNPNLLDRLTQFRSNIGDHNTHTILSVDGQPGYTYADTAATTNPGVVAGIEDFTNGCSSLNGKTDTMPNEFNGIPATTLYCYDPNPNSL